MKYNISDDLSERLKVFAKDFTPEQKDRFIELVVEYSVEVSKEMAKDLMDKHLTIVSKNLKALLM